MLRRWIIRSFFLVLLLLVAVAWPISHFWRLDLVYNRNIHGGSLNVFPGHLGITWNPNRFTPTNRWYVTTSAVKPEEINLFDTLGWNFIGFGAGKFSLTITNEPRYLFGTDPPAPSPAPALISHTSTTRFIRIPFWFLTTVSALLLFFVWQKTVRHNPARAFPIELTKISTP